MPCKNENIRKKYEERNQKPNTSPVFRNDIRQALEVLKKGGVILYPTDTVWGLGCDATNETAVQRIYDIKRRCDSKALITLVDSVSRLSLYVRDIPDVAIDVIELSNRPTTVIFDGGRNLAPNLLAEDGSVGIRVTAESFSKELCFRFQRAIVSTSANISGMPTPRNFDEIAPEIREAVDYVVQFHQKDKTKKMPSSIIKIGTHGEVKVIR